MEVQYSYCNNHVNGDVVVNGGYSRSNSASNGGFAYLEQCPFQMENEFHIINNTALVNGGAIHAQNSRLVFNGSFFNISCNSAKSKGGALEPL